VKSYSYTNTIEYYGSTADYRRPKKKLKVENLSSITIGYLHSRKGSEKARDIKRMKILLDSGCGATLINQSLIGKLKTTKEQKCKWKTKAGNFTTNRKCKIKFSLPALFENRDIDWNCYVDESSPTSCLYDLIIGRDLMHELGIDICFSTAEIKWDNASIAMQPTERLDELNIEEFEQEILFAHDPDTTDAERIQNIVESKYCPADLEALVKECKELEKLQQEKLFNLLSKFAPLFDGTLGTWKTDPIELELKDPNEKPYHAKPYPIPHSQEKKLREEVERLVKYGVLRKINRSEWACPMFVITKPDGSLRSLADLRELNKRIKRKPFPIPKITDMLQKLEGFSYATSLDLNMGYYHIELTPDSSRLCTIVLPWGKYEYRKLPMGLCNSPDIFQEKMSELMAGLEFCRAYIDDLLVVSKGNFEQHLDHLEQSLTRLSEAGLKVNATKSHFCKTELEYLGYLINKEGVRPTMKKVEAIKNIATPTTRKQLRGFIGMVNYYRDMWPKRAHLLAPLSAMTSSKVKWKWTEECQKSFELMKEVIAKETLLTYPQFDKPFEIHTDASKVQLGACISQEGKPIAFYSRKLNPAQTRYTTTERELLSIVETLKEFRNILLGQQIIVHTDHENLTYKNFNSDRVMRWRLFIEEYSPDLRYIKGEHNIVADSLSRLPKTISDLPKSEDPLDDSLEAFYSTMDCYAKAGIKEADTYDFHPLSYAHLDTAQQSDQDIKKELQKDTCKYHLTDFHGGGTTRSLVCYKNKIVVPKQLQKHTIDWYHTTLCHPGINRTEETIGQHLWWPKMRDQITKHVQVCPTCQRNKRKVKKYGWLPPKEAEAEPWDKMCIDLIGPYKIRRKGRKDLVCKCVTMIDPATGWFEIHQYDDKRSMTVANIAEQEWFARYPWPTQVTFDRGSEFIGKDFQKMIKEDYAIKAKPITVRNPQANAIVERIHQVIGNMVRTFELENNYLDEDDPWKGILSATAFAIRSTYHTTLQHTPGQLVFGRDMIFNIKHAANWEYIKQRKQQIINQNNKRENAKRKKHTYNVGDQVLLSRGNEFKYESPFTGPHEILKVNDNGTVRLQVKAVADDYNLRRLYPYHSANDPNHGGECNMRNSRKRRRI
jgi:transposase InsO family protein/exonuclease VII small subunit